MKLRYTFEMVDMDGDMVAVPVGDDADQFKGLVKLNKSASEIFILLQEEKSEKEIIDILSERYPDNADEIAGFVEKYLKRLEDDYLLIR